jgi:methyl-galactoside transport system substrate-binding protein
MKKPLRVLFLVFASLAGCSGPAPGDKPSIGVAVHSLNDAFASKVRDSILASGGDRARIEAVDSKNSQAEQNAQVEVFLAGKAGAIAVSLVDPSAAAPIIEKAKDKKVPLVFFRSEPPIDDLKGWDKVFYVGPRAEQSGAVQGRMVADWWKADPRADRNGDGKLQYALLAAESSPADADPTSRPSIRPIVDSGVDVEKLGEEVAFLDGRKALEKTGALLAAHGERIEVLFCDSDEMALAAVKALKSAGYFAGKRRMAVVGSGATVAALAAIEEGSLLGTVLDDPRLQGKAVFDLAYALARRVAPSKSGLAITDGKYLWIDCRAVTKDNYKQLR